MPCFDRRHNRPCRAINESITVVAPTLVYMHKPRVAVVYSGRWNGEHGAREAIRNHLERLIRPNRASVYIATDVSNWCAAPLDLVERYATYGSFGRAGSNTTAASGGTHAAGTVTGPVSHHELEEAFCAQVQSAFSGLWDDVSCALLPEEDAGLAQRYLASAASRFGSLFGGYMRSWYLQTARFARANAFRRVRATGPHDLIVRARFDLWFNKDVHLKQLPTRPPLVHALAYAINATGEPHAAFSPSISVTRQCWRSKLHPWGESDAYGRNVTEPCPEIAKGVGAPNGQRTAVLWRDWLYAGNEEAMEALGTMGRAPHRVHFNDHTRCYGACPEEQTALQIEHEGLPLKELPWPVGIIPPKCDDALWLRPLLNRSTANLASEAVHTAAVGAADANGLPCAKYSRHIHSKACRTPCRGVRRDQQVHFSQLINKEERFQDVE